jgi:hypothetical protein
VGGKRGLAAGARLNDEQVKGVNPRGYGGAEVADGGSEAGFTVAGMKTYQQRERGAGISRPPESGRERAHQYQANEQRALGNPL